jgi:hypothetical protein
MFLSSLKSQIMDTEFTLVAQKGTLRLLFDDSIQPASILKMNARTFHEAMAGTLNLPASLFKQSPGDRRRYQIGIGIDKIGKSTQYNLPNCF